MLNIDRVLSGGKANKEGVKLVHYITMETTVRNSYPKLLRTLQQQYDHPIILQLNAL